VQIGFFQVHQLGRRTKSWEETVERSARHTAFTRDGAFCTNCCFGATTKKLDEKASLYEGHGFSRAVKTYALDGFSR
jgi:hypothetical protein